MATPSSTPSSSSTDLIEASSGLRGQFRPGTGLVFAAWFAVALGLGLFWNSWLAGVALLILSTAVGLGLIVDYRALDLGRRSARASRTIPDPIARNRPFVIRITAEIAGAPNGLRVLLRDIRPPHFQDFEILDGMAHGPDLFGWSGPGPFMVAYRGKIALRGHHEFAPLLWIFQGPWNCLEWLGEQSDKSVVRILPEAMVAPEELIRRESEDKSLRDRNSKAILQGDGIEFESLREFQTGDDPRRIDWRTTARTQHLTIRKFQVEQNRDVLILLDTGRLMGVEAGGGTKVDHGVESALLLARTVIEGGDRVGLLVFDHEVRHWHAPRRSGITLRRFAETLAPLQPRDQETDYLPALTWLQSRQAKRALIIVLSDFGDETTSGLARGALLSLQKRHLVLFAGFQTPWSDRGHLLQPESMKQGLETVVWMRFREQRHRALQSLARSGIRILDHPPGKLSIPLLNTYLKVRRENRL